MANLALIRGARDAANKFVDVTGVVRQAVLRGEAAFLRQAALERAEKEKSETFRLQLLARGDTLQKSKIAPEMQGYATNKAMQLQQQFRQTLLNPDVSKEDQVIALQNYNSQIDEITSFNQQFLEFQDNFRKLETSQLSDLNDAERLSNARMIATGQFQWDGENFILGQGENQKVVNAQQLFSQDNQEIIKETVGYNKLLADFQSLGLEQGYKKVPEELFDQMVEQRFKGSDINQMNNAGLASIVVDYISNESVDPQTESDNMQQKQMLKEALKQDYADDGLLNASSAGVKQIVSDSGLPYREYLLNYIKDNVKKATKTQYNIGLKNAPKVVNDPSKPTEGDKRRQINFDNASTYSGEILQKTNDYFNDQINELPKNESGVIMVKDALNAITVNTKKNSPELQNFQKYLSDIGWYISAYNDDDTINIKNQAGTKTIEVYNGQPIGNLIKSILLLEGIDRRTSNLLYSYIGAGIIGANFTPPTLEELLEYERELNKGKTDDELDPDEISDEFNSKK